MPDHQHRLTDLDHLDTVATRIAGNLARLTRAWIHEHQAAYAPRSRPDGPGANGPADPTATIADHPGKHRDADHIGATLLHVDRKLTELLTRLTPRTPTRRCTCCRTEMATHGADSDGNPTACWACDRYLRIMSHPCDDAVHEGRPKIRMCECPTWCCDVCPDRAAEGRSLSDRCRQRMRRARLREVAS